MAKVVCLCVSSMKIRPLQMRHSTYVCCPPNSPAAIILCFHFNAYTHAYTLSSYIYLGEIRLNSGLVKFFLVLFSFFFSLALTKLTELLTQRTAHHCVYVKFVVKIYVFFFGEIYCLYVYVCVKVWFNQLEAEFIHIYIYLHLRAVCFAFTHNKCVSWP